MLLTFGGLGVWWVIDLILVASGKLASKKPSESVKEKIVERSIGVHEKSIADLL